MLSVQSHVVSGYVGNKVAAFALQLLGANVDVLNTCQLSNHTGYRAGAPGPKTSADEFATVLDGLAANNLLAGINHVLTGACRVSSPVLAVLRSHRPPSCR